MTPEERQSRIYFLEGLGVPRPYHDEIIDAPTNRIQTWGGTVLALALIALIVAVMATTFGWLTQHVQARAADLAAQNGATLTYVNVGIGPIFLLFGLLSFMGWAACVAAGQHRVKGFRSSSAGLLNPHPGQKASTKQFMRWMLIGSVRRAAARSTDIDGFLHAVADHQASRWGIGAIVLLTPAIVFTALETNSFWVAGPSGVVEHRMFPPLSSHRHDLKDVTRVTTGCNNLGKDNRLIYDIHLASGESFGLGYAEPAKSGDVRAVEAIDARLARDIVHRRWSHLDRDPVHPLCLRHWATQFDRDGPRRLAKLLRLTPDELRTVLAR